MLLTMPMIQLLLFGYAINMNVDHIPTAVADQSLDSASQEYVGAMVSSSYFDVVTYVSSQEEVVQAIDAGQAQAGIVIPPDFGAHVERGDAQVLFLVDGSDLFTTQSAYNAATVVAQVHTADIVMEKVERSGLSASGVIPLETRTRVLYNPDMAQLWFIIPGMAAMLLQTQSIAMTAAAVVREREVGTMEQLLVTPIRPIELMLGKITPNIIIAILNMLTVIAFGVFVFGVPFQGSFWLFFGLSFIYVFSGLGMGLLISTVCTNLRQTQQLVMLVMLLGVVLGGFMFPRESMPQLMQYLGLFFPLTYFMPIARGIITKGIGIDFLWGQVFSLVLYSVVVIFVAVRVFRQGLE
jgi:ABC-2 type transport system permease protein